MEEIGGAAKRVERHALVQPLEHLRMRGLQPNRDLETTAQQRLKSPASIGVDAGEKRRVCFDDHALEAGNNVRDLLIVFRRDLLRIKKASGVVQLDVTRSRKIRKPRANLLRDGTAWHDLVERVRPQVAHHTTERTLAIGQKDNGGRNERAGIVWLLFP